MRLLIIRHAPAVDREDWAGDDQDRPLTRAGERTGAKILRALTPIARVEEILTSPWTRARATAELAAEAWRLPLHEVPWLAGGETDAVGMALHCSRLTHPVALIGHEPDLGELIGRLTGTSAVPLKKAGAALLTGSVKPAGMTLRTLLAPKDLLRLYAD